MLPESHRSFPNFLDRFPKPSEGMYRQKMLAIEVDSKQLGNNVVLAKGAVFLKKKSQESDGAITVCWLNVP